MRTYDWLETELSFFDSEEEKERKMRALQSLTEEEKAERKEFLQGLERVESKNKLTLSESLDMIPSILDGEKLYDRKRKDFLSFYPEETILPKEKIIFPIERRFGQPVEMKKPSRQFVVTETENESIDNFIYRDGCLIYMDVENEREIEIGNYWISIVREVVRVQTLVTEQNMVKDWIENSTWEVEILCAGEKYHGIYTVSQLKDLRTILTCTRDRAYLSDGKGVRPLYAKYIHKLIEQSAFKTQYIFDSTGWINYKNQGWVYVTDVGVIGKSNLLMKANVPYHFDYDAIRVGEKSVFQEFFGLRFLCTGKVQNSIFLMHYSCLAVMTTLFQEA